MTPLQEILMRPDAVEMVEYKLSQAARDQGVVPMVHPQLTAQALTAIAGVVEECIGPDEPASTVDQEEQWIIDGRNELRAEIRNNLKAAGVLK